MPEDIFPAWLAGTGLGLLALFPGFHFAMIILVAGPWILQHFSVTSAILCMASSVCTARCMHTLAVVYHPVSADNIASADPAQRLAAAGQGRYATALMGDALWTSVRVVCFILTGVLLVGMLQHENIIKSWMKLGSLITVPAILTWAGFVLWNAERKVSTLLAFMASGLLGVVALLHPAVEGSSHTMTPLLTGLFALPVLMATLLEKHSSRQRIQLEKQPEVEVCADLEWFGMLAGLTSVVLPGLGTSSLVSVGQGFAETDADYLSMAAHAESTGELLALVLGILSIASRSSDAAIIQQVMETHIGEFALNPSFAFLLLGTLVVSCFVGLKLVKLVSFPYRLMVQLIPVKLQALVVSIAMVSLVWHHTRVWGLGIMLTGTLIHLGAKQLRVSNQVFFACMTVPMILYTLSIRPFQ